MKKAVGSPFSPRENAPQWFLENLEQPGQSVFTEVGNRSVHMLTWNWQRVELPTLMLVHGFGANANWWSFLAPFFTDRYRVVALDMPGMGDSDPPAVYEDQCFANAIIGCIEQHQLGPVRIVGHSFGGAQSIRAMATSPHLFTQGIIVDTNVRLPPEPPIRNLLPRGKHRTSPTQADCIARFRLVPPQPDYIESIIDFIAYHACTGNKNGWHWKSDPDCINVGEIDGPSIIESVQTHVDMIYGEASFLNINDKPARVLTHFPNAGTLTIIPKAGHHIMVDYPLALVSAIKQLLDQ